MARMKLFSGRSTMIPRSYIEKYSWSLNRADYIARRKLSNALAAVDYSQSFDVIRDEVIRIMQTHCGAADTVASRMAAEFYDGMRQFFDLDTQYKAIVSDEYNPEATEGAVRAFVEDIIQNDKEAFAQRCLERQSYEMRRAANRCVRRNVRRDPNRPRYARVPTGAETCEFCIMLASRGFVYYTEDLASHSHANCVVGDTKVSGAGLLACLRREYKGPLVHIVTRANRELTVTPNHPILTTRGWVSAGEVVESDNLICANLFDGHGSGVPNVDDEPPTIEQVFEAGGFFDSSALDCMPATTKYLHREAFSDCDVKVVNPLGLLERAFKSSSDEPIAHEGFTFAGKSCAIVGETLDSDGAPDAFIDGSSPAKHGTMGSFCLCCPLFWRHFGSPDQPSVRASAKLDARLCEPSGYGLAANAEPFGDGVDAFAIVERFYNAAWHVDALAARLDAISSQDAVDGGLSNAELVANLVGAHPSLIEIDDVLSVSVRNSRCHVYNLSTAGGWYVSSGIITHNCDCRVVPSWDKSPEVEDYDPDYYLDVYNNPDAHPEVAEARNARRRELYAQRKDETSRPE